eukprot:CAMPEP_0119396736 /NCGR_PEP_ID=MMETSP1334-20130426/138063_1 /TAXON_ID=127549 /ORGANISM="Calcidiscus leptoporus, Strain RCC1130" /LENGTH=59 /DNA_ID=CAMNT_0007420439 /DNA_START=25 /DNA_END=200 /DNA_ORIENTATION=-
MPMLGCYTRATGKGAARPIPEQRVPSVLANELVAQQVYTHQSPSLGQGKIRLAGELLVA